MSRARLGPVHVIAAIVTADWTPSRRSISTRERLPSKQSFISVCETYRPVYRRKPTSELLRPSLILDRIIAMGDVCLPKIAPTIYLIFFGSHPPNLRFE